MIKIWIVSFTNSEADNEEIICYSKETAEMVNSLFDGFSNISEDFMEV